MEANPDLLDAEILPVLKEKWKWSKEELERLYTGIRKYRNDWVKVAEIVQTKSKKDVQF